MSPDEHVLLVSMPLRHLESARQRCDRDGAVVLPAGGPGALPRVEPGTKVLFIAIATQGEDVPAATWSATFEEEVPHEEGETWPARLPSTWTDEHPYPPLPVTEAATVGSSDADEDDEPFDEPITRQSFFRVRDLAPLPKSQWIHANEMVTKQRRGGRAFVPRVPTLVSSPD